ncbi:C45 family peptidase [Accumulibacter sp.]|uniref:C45 family autoproteolytic acyltransferase/hydolase n=1 Tax=Accumulibacter sp. TaxID=2053492 RepID=UPI0025DE6900|nr:C45 family peptidase [Accumulibacter sp.]
MPRADQPIHQHFTALVEDAPGPLWQALFERCWPGYRDWYLRSGVFGRPSYLECRRALREHMPELVPTWTRLVELAGGGDVEARALSMWCPPAYIAGCAQAVWIDPAGAQGPALLRNYDYAPALLEGNWLATRWCGQRVLAMADCLWGVLDGMNEAGLAASLSFGGRTQAGEGFGIPLVMRYLLEVSSTVEEACAVLKRVPVHMSYSITLLDTDGHWATVFVGPDAATYVSRRRAITNFQHKVDWPEHARATSAVERLNTLEHLVDKTHSLPQVAAALLQPPLFQTSYRRGYGTLYSALYQPTERLVELFWQDQRWQQSLLAPQAGERHIVFPTGPS